MGLCEPLKQQNFIRTGAIQSTAGTQVDVIESRFAVIGQRHGPRLQGQVQPRYVDQCAASNPAFRCGYPGNGGQIGDQSVGRASHRSKNISQPIAFVIGFARFIQRGDEARHHDQHQHADTDNSANGDGLSLDAP